MALLTLTALAEKTMRSRCPRCAPGAMRMPNSLVRWATV
jgi:ribosomal protein S27AE